MNSKTDHIRLKELFRPLRESMADFSEGNVRRSIHALFTSDTTIRMCHPFGDSVSYTHLTLPTKA